MEVELMKPGFYLQDCMEALKQFPDKFFSLAICDPPYGINVANHELGKIVGGGIGRSVVLPNGTIKRTRVHPGNPTIPSMTASHRTKVISRNWNGCASTVSFGEETSCWITLGKRHA